MKILIVASLICANVCAPAWARSQNSTSTVRGPLVAMCRPIKNSHEGRYSYTIAGKRVVELSSDCTLDHAISYVNIEQIIRSPNSTTLLIVEGQAADWQNVRVLHIPQTGPVLFVDTIGGDGIALVQLGNNKFRLTVPSGGFALSEERKSTWTCVISINFDQRRASGDLAIPYEQGLTSDVCSVSVEQAKL